MNYLNIFWKSVQSYPAVQSNPTLSVFFFLCLCFFCFLSCFFFLNKKIKNSRLIIGGQKSVLLPILIIGGACPGCPQSLRLCGLEWIGAGSHSVLTFCFYLSFSVRWCGLSSDSLRAVIQGHSYMYLECCAAIKGYCNGDWWSLGGGGFSSRCINKGKRSSNVYQSAPA